MKIFYGWRIVVAGGLIQFLQGLLLHHAFGAYFAVLIEERGWSKTALSGAAALQPMEAAVLGPVLGWMFDRFGSQGMIRAGIVTFGIGFMLLSQIETLTGFYAAYFVIALGSSLSGNFAISVSFACGDTARLEVSDAGRAIPAAIARELAAGIAGARFMEIPGVGHCPQIEDPQAFVAAVNGFLPV